MKMSDNLIDPLLVLLRRHEAANAAYDALSSNASEAERDIFTVCTAKRCMHLLTARRPRRPPAVL
jgi:hypothetical protein